MVLILKKKFDEVSTLKLFDVFHLPILRNINCLKRLDEYGVGQIEKLAPIFRIVKLRLGNQWDKFKDLIASYKDLIGSDIWKLCFLLE